MCIVVLIVKPCIKRTINNQQIFFVFNSCWTLWCKFLFILEKEIEIRNAERKGNRTANSTKSKTNKIEQFFMILQYPVYSLVPCPKGFLLCLQNYFFNFKRRSELWLEIIRIQEKVLLLIVVYTLEKFEAPTLKDLQMIHNASF